jgi:hypothetical protein
MYAVKKCLQQTVMEEILEPFFVFPVLIID